MVFVRVKFNFRWILNWILTIIEFRLPQEKDISGFGFTGNTLALAFIVCLMASVLSVIQCDSRRSLLIRMDLCPLYLCLFSAKISTYQFMAVAALCDLTIHCFSQNFAVDCTSASCVCNICSIYKQRRLTRILTD